MNGARGEKRGMLGLDRVGNRRSWSFLTRNFSMGNGRRAQKRKKTDPPVLSRTKLALRPVTSVVSRPRRQGSDDERSGKNRRTALDPAPGSQGEAVKSRLNLF
jgi:hypothetical protein